MNIVFDVDFPEDIAIKAICEKFSFLLPQWLQTLYVSFDAKDVECTAYIGSNEVYRFMRLTICPAFLTCQQDEREQIIVHEFVHGHLNSLTELARELADKAFETNYDAAQIIKKQIDSFNESATQDLAFVVYNLIKKHGL